MGDNYKLKKGDKVWVEGTIAFDHALVIGTITVDINGTYCYPIRSQIEVIRLAFRKGDLCIFQETPCTVVSVDGEEVWVKNEDGTSTVVDASELTRPPEPPQPDQPETYTEEPDKVT